MFMGPRNWFQEMNSARLCSLAGRYDNPIPPRFLAPIDFLKIPALAKFPLWVKGNDFSLADPTSWNWPFPYTESSMNNFALCGWDLAEWLLVRASDSQWRGRNCPGDPSIIRHSGIWGAADEAVLNIVKKYKKNLKIPLELSPKNS